MDTSAALWYNHSGHLIDSTHQRLSSYGSMLPVLVVEAISNEDVPVQSLSIAITDSGWACLVSGTSLFVWKFTSGPSRPCPCYELELPPSDLSFRADLVTMIEAEENRVTVLAVSPEGIVRFWPNIMHESCFTETVVHELQGQECSNTCLIRPNVCLLATTTNSLLLITIRQNETVFRTLKAPVGVLSGLGKKFTSFIFGGMPVTHNNDTKSFIRIFRESHDPGQDFSLVYTMAGSMIQKWQIFSNDSEVLRAEKDVDHVLKDQFVASMAVTSDPRQANVLILDAGLGKENDLLLLVACLVPGDQTRFAFAVFASIQDSIALMSFSLISDPSAILTVYSEDSILNLKLLICPDRSTIYVYDESRVFFIRNHTVVDHIDFEVNEDGILGAGICDNVPLLFTCKDGLVMISPTIVDQVDDCSIFQTKQIVEPNTQMADKFKNAFCLFSHNDKEKAISVMNSSFDLISRPEELGYIILKFVEENADGDLSSDSVWEDRVRRRKVPQSFSSQDIHVTRQLEDKIATINEIIALVHAIPALSDLVLDNMPLLLSLNETLEKLMVALSAKFYRMEFYYLTEPVLMSMAENRGSCNKNFIHDEFFRAATRVHEIVPELVRFAESKLDPSLMNGEETLQLLLSTSDLVCNIMSDVLSRRNRLPAAVMKFCGKLENFNSWDSVADGTRSHLIRLISLMENPGCRLAATSDLNKQNRDSVFDKITHLADVVLNSYTHQIRFLRQGSVSHATHMRNMTELRSNFLRPMVSAAEYDRAVALAEKYLDFDTLIEVSEKVNDTSFLDKYSVMFSSQGFTGHLFEWYMKRGRQEKVLQSPHMFSQMLEGHSDLQWLQQMEQSDFHSAAQTLRGLAVRENGSLAKKKTMLSLCKLAQLVNPELYPNSDVDQILQQQNSTSASDVSQSQ